VIQVEADAVAALAGAIDEHFQRAVRLILDCPGAVVTSGIGKSGIIARKLSASFSSTGTPSHFLNPVEAVHGDAGSLRKGDLVVVMSDSGESDEISRMLSIFKKLGHPLIALTSSRTSTLGRLANLTLAYGKIEEACPLGLAPSATTTALLALGDALCLTVMKMRKFTAEEFALFHPGGNLGRKFIKVSEAMTFRQGKNLPVASDALNVGQVLHEVSHIRRRSGAVILIDASGKLSGIFSDADLRRLLTDNDESALQRPIKQVMTRQPKTIVGDALASDALAILHTHRLDELPVVDASGCPIGLIDVQDLVLLKMLDLEEP
jgi:arabinose-5-phosphate isomerase